MSENKREKIYTVALLVSAWIETKPIVEYLQDYFVALLVSAWIETKLIEPLPEPTPVALLVSAWIETSEATPKIGSRTSHSS